MTNASDIQPTSGVSENAKPRRRRIGRSWKIAFALAGFVIAGAFAGIALYLDPLINTVAEQTLAATIGDTTLSRIKIRPGTIQYTFTDNAVRMDRALLVMRDSLDGGPMTLYCEVAATEIIGVDWLGLITGGGLQIDEIRIERPELRIIGAALGNTTESGAADSALTETPLVPDTGSDEQLEPLTKSPAMLERVFPLRIGKISTGGGRVIHSGILSAGRLGDTIHSISGIMQGIALDKYTDDAPLLLDICRSIEIAAKDFDYHPLDSDYALHIEGVRWQSSANFISVDSLRYEPVIDDESFFAKRKFRSDRFRIRAAHIGVFNFDIRALISHRAVLADSLAVRGLELDILSDKIARIKRNSRPRMPHMLMEGVPISGAIGMITLADGSIVYGERFAHSSVPAQLHFTDLNASIAGFGTRDILDRPTGAPAPLKLLAQARLMDAGEMQLDMDLPLYSDNFSLMYKGALKSMDLRALNNFVPIAEGIKITSGDLQRSDFHIIVENGRARGTVYAIYDDLEIAKIDRETGEEGGFLNSVASFLANAFVVSSSNIPDDDGDMELGAVAYTRKPDDPFFGYLWFALRSGLGDIVGF